MQNWRPLKMVSPSLLVPLAESKVVCPSQFQVMRTAVQIIVHLALSLRGRYCDMGACIRGINSYLALLILGIQLLVYRICMMYNATSCP